VTIADALDWTASPLVPAVVQDPQSLQVLMIGFMNREALEKSASTGFVTFFSRSRNTLWTKGETSGNVLTIEEIRINCEENSLLVLARPTGPTCHTGFQTCYYRRLESDGSLTILLERVEDPATIYGAQLDNASLVQRWFGAYEYLRDHDLSAESGTSRRLREPAFPFEERIADELKELAGVLDGSHVHNGLNDDLLLEGSQVIYWITQLLVRSHVSIKETRLADAFAQQKSLDPRAIATELAERARAWQSTDQDRATLAHRADDTMWVVGVACQSTGIDPYELIRYDLAELEQRPYLSAYFAN
jgi:phosphoribosyl-AMP cyclohydrolase/phosphoribosyl-ATP pyrophosphohydrolase